VIRRRITVDYDLPMRDDYSTFIQKFLDQPLLKTP